MIRKIALLLSALLCASAPSQTVSIPETVAVTETDSLTQLQSVRIPVTISPRAAATTNVLVATDFTGSATPGSEFYPTSRWLTFQERQSAATFVIVLRGDTLAEPDESVGLQIVMVDGPVSIGNGSCNVHIEDNDAAFVPPNIIPGVSAGPEGDTWHFVQIPVALDAPTTGLVRYDYLLVSGPTNIGEVHGSHIILPGHTEPTYPAGFWFHGDTQPGPDSVFQFRLIDVEGADYDGALGTVVLSDDD